MKTKVCKMLVFILISVALMSAVSCSDEVDMTGKMTLVIGGDYKKEYYVKVDEIEGNRGLYSLLDHLDLDYTFESGEFSQVGPLKYSSGDSEYLCVYTSVEEYAAKDPFTLEYRGKTLLSVGVDFEDMKISEGDIIYIGIIRYK